MSLHTFLPGVRVKIDTECFHLRKKLPDSRWQLENEIDGEFKVFLESELLTLYSEGRLAFISDFEKDEFDPQQVVEERLSKAFSDYSQELQDVAAKRLKYVKAHNVVGEIQRLHNLEQVAKEFGDEKPPSLSTLNRWTNVLKHSQQNICSLIPRYFKRGNRLKRFPQRVEKIAFQKLFELYLKLEPETLYDTLSAVRDAIRRENLARPSDEQLPTPGRKFLRRLLGTLDEYEIMLARQGKAVADHFFRESFKSGERVKELLERVEIDHTTLDLIVVHPETYLPLGRPTLTVMKDRCSRCILGFYISFDPPSYIQVMKCLAHAIKPKGYVSTKYPEIENSWPCYGIPQLLVVDNGREFHSKDLEAAALSLLMDIRYGPVAQPWWKGSVERFFRTVSKDLIHKIPGTTFSNIFEKGGYNSKDWAIMTMDVLDQVLHNWICDVYHQIRHRSMNCSPISRWRELVEPSKIKLPESTAALDISISSFETRTLFHYGIEMNSLRYNSKELMALRRKKGTHVVKIRWDRSDLGYIHVLDEDTNRYVQVPCSWFEYASGTSLWVHKIIREEAKNEEGEENQVKLDAAKERIRSMCQSTVSRGKKISATKTAARTEQGLGGQMKPKKNQKTMEPSSTQAQLSNSAEEKPVWIDEEDDNIPKFTTSKKPNKGRYY